MLRRRQVNTQSSFFVNRLATSDFASANDIGAAFYASLVCRSNFLGSVRFSLDAQVEALGCPSVFFTLSPVDLQWESLMRLMLRYDEWLAVNNDGRLKIARANLKRYSHIASKPVSPRSWVKP
ncbi:uncharacterized protein F4807DRAFT_463595 [Annulohypoxylon truncatum]|uniref:uncharacterized protein n=1 Tax=Annulohypoxylon truncatum TaxID=327061 RepID=UPI0020085151|nr:uncharacterized protein F4807DRAFT_463595 [Annulohypoxylon truncatum]KAI1206649.1 hypothetical protein F4807DRAFT_463595 [Annulohypoxylon truncatum]